MATRYAESDIYKRGSCISRWLRGTQRVIYTRESCVSRWLRGTLRVIYTREEVVLVGGYAVRSE